MAIDDARLFPIIGGRINFLAVIGLRPDKMDKDNRGNQAGLAVLPRHAQKRAANLAAPVWVLRIVDAPNEILLPIAQDERLTAILAGWNLQTFDKRNDALGAR